MGTLAVQAAAILSLASCSLVSDVTDELAARIYGRTWIAEEVAGQPVPGGLEPSLTVAPDGKVSGHAGCNGYFGSVIISGEALSDRKSVVEGKSVSVRVDLGVRRIIKKKRRTNHK